MTSDYSYPRSYRGFSYWRQNHIFSTVDSGCKSSRTGDKQYYRAECILILETSHNIAVLRVTEQEFSYWRKAILQLFWRQAILQRMGSYIGDESYYSSVESGRVSSHTGDKPYYSSFETN